MQPVLKEVRELRQYNVDEKRLRHAFEKEVKDEMERKIESLQFQHRSIENDLRAQIGDLRSENEEQKREIIRVICFFENFQNLILINHSERSVRHEIM